MLSVHLAVGVGYYHHLILKLQIEYDLDLIGVVDFTFVQTESISSYVSVYAYFDGSKYTACLVLLYCIDRINAFAPILSTHTFM